MAWAACEGAPMPASMISGTSGKYSRSVFKRIGVGKAATRADRRTPGHQHLAADGHQALGNNQVLGGVGKDLEAVLDEDCRSLDQPEGIGLQGVVVADHLELDPVGGEQLACHLRGGDRFFGRAAARRVWQDTHPETLDEVEEALAGCAARHLPAQGNRDDRCARCRHRIAHDLGRGKARRADEQARGHLDAVKVERLGWYGLRLVQVHVRSLSATLAWRHDLYLIALA